MAVRDKEQQTLSVNRLGRDLPWRDTLGHLPAVLAVGAVTIYAYLSLCYDRFYGGLGVNPDDVGLSYTGTLARSAGFVVAYLVAALLMGPLVARSWQDPIGAGNVWRVMGVYPSSHSASRLVSQWVRPRARRAL
jgi:hypothetical protein